MVDFTNIKIFKYVRQVPSDIIPGKFIAIIKLSCDIGIFLPGTRACDYDQCKIIEMTDIPQAFFHIKKKN